MATSIMLASGLSDLSSLCELELCHLSSYIYKVACLHLFCTAVIQAPVICEISFFASYSSNCFHFLSRLFLTVFLGSNCSYYSCFVGEVLVIHSDWAICHTDWAICHMVLTIFNRVIANNKQSISPDGWIELPTQRT